MKYKTYPLYYKFYILNVITGNDLCDMSIRFGINKRTLRRWQNKGVKKNRGGGGRKIQDPEMEEKLMKWYFKEIKKRKIKTREFKEKAKELSNINGFKASKGWLQKLRRRYIIKLN